VNRCRRLEVYNEAVIGCCHNYMRAR
jgi:hypothetical protein